MTSTKLSPGPALLALKDVARTRETPAEQRRPAAPAPLVYRWDISIRRKNDKVTAALRQLNLYATAADIRGSLDALERKKMELLEDLTAADEVECLPAVESAQRIDWRFALKVVIVVVLTAAAVVITTNLIATKIETTRLAWQETLRDSTGIGGRQFWSKVEKSLDDLANPKSEMPEDKRQKILSDIRAIRDRWWPFIAAAMPPDVKSK